MNFDYRNNVIDFASIYLDKEFVWDENGPDYFDSAGFTYFIFKELLDVDINKDGYGLDNSTKQLTNGIGDLKIYKEDDFNKINYLKNIKKGDLLFFHTKSLDDNGPTVLNNFPGHVGIYFGDNKFIHASYIKEKVVIEELDDKWLNILVASRDIIGDIIEKNYVS